jgi:Tol biopolymer transport system component
MMSWEPDGEIETPAEVLEAVNQVVAADLARFKDFIEARRAGAGSPRAESAA